MFKNSTQGYGLISIALHWGVAVAVVGLFTVGLWMHGLDYDNPWYNKAPYWHKSFGVLLIAIMMFRIVWRLANPVPAPLLGHKPWEKLGAKLVHFSLYALVLAMLPTGYLITTAKGHGLNVFNLFDIPAMITDVENMEDIAGETHEIIAFTIMGLAGIHALGAIKHHFINKDITLLRIFGRQEDRKTCRHVDM